MVRVNPSYGINTASTGTLIGVTKDYANYTSGSDLVLIDKGTLENVITGKGLNISSTLSTSQSSSWESKSIKYFFYKFRRKYKYNKFIAQWLYKIRIY